MLVWRVNSVECAVPLDRVEEVTQAVAVTPSLGGSSAAMLGYLDLRGRVVPAFDARRLLGRPAREMQLSDSFVVTASANGLIALLVDQVHGIERVTMTDAPDGEHVPLGRPDAVTRGRRRLDDGSDTLIAVIDIDRLLSDTEPMTGRHSK